MAGKGFRLKGYFEIGTTFWVKDLVATKGFKVEGSTQAGATYRA